MKKFSLASLSLLILLLAQSSAFAQLPKTVTCADGLGGVLAVDNQEVLNWKRTTKDQFQDRSLVQGTISKLFADATGHTHFAIDLNGDRAGDLEVIYNDEFGSLPILQVGMTVMACGDYITVGPHARRPSPMGAIIHWVHYNPGDRDGGRHPHGFLVIQGRLYGFPSRK